MKPKTSRLRTILICLGLALATTLVYWRVGGFNFLNYDDIYIFFNNPMVRTGLTWSSIKWGATTCFYEYWHPLMWWSHELDCQLFGLSAGPHHLMSLGIHVLNSLLVFAVFRRMTGMEWRSTIVAALFALHPLHVESVAWLAERKDLLSTTFWLLSIWAYVCYVEKSNLRTRGYKLRYALALLFFLLGLLTKPMVVTLPFVLLLLDYWPLNRLSDLRLAISDLKSKRADSLAWLIREKWPFFVLTILFCFITWYSVKLGNNFPDVSKLPSVSVRLANIPIAYVRYLWKTIDPSNLAVLYPMPDSWPWREILGAALILLFISWQVLVRARSARYLTFGWLMFLGVLLPTIGIVQVGEQAMADRYMYLPLIGLAAAAVWDVADLVTNSKLRSRAPIILGSATALVLGACTWISSIQVQYWHDSIPLWEHCLATGNESLIAHQNLGRAFLDIGEPDNGVKEYQAALNMDPADRDANLGYGSALVSAGKSKEATNYLASALFADPNDARAHLDMGLALTDLGDYDNAVSEFTEVIRLDPEDPRAYAYMGKVCSARGKSDEAVRYFFTALEVNPSYAAGHYYLGVEFLGRGELDKAASSLKKAVQFGPAMIAPHMQLADVYGRLHETAKAIPEYRAALSLNPSLLEALNNLAWILATAPDPSLRNGKEAVELSARACLQTSWQQTVFIGTLAAAYAEAGDFDNAVKTAQKACDLASTHGEKNLLHTNQELLARYQKHQPFRDTN